MNLLAKVAVYLVFMTIGCVGTPLAVALVMDRLTPPRPAPGAQDLDPRDIPRSLTAWERDMNEREREAIAKYQSNVQWLSVAALAGAIGGAVAAGVVTRTTTKRVPEGPLPLT